MNNEITLRDYIAAKAMQGMMTDKNYEAFDMEDITSEAYDWADAMLKAREQ